MTTRYTAEHVDMFRRMMTRRFNAFPFSGSVASLYAGGVTGGVAGEPLPLDKMPKILDELAQLVAAHVAQHESDMAELRELRRFRASIGAALRDAGITP